MACGQKWAGCFLTLLFSPCIARCEDHPVRFRARVTQILPEGPVRIFWRYGGEGLGGKPVTGELTRSLPAAPSSGSVPEQETGRADDNLKTEELKTQESPVDRIIVEGGTYDYEYLQLGAWTQPLPLSTFGSSRGRLFVTFFLLGKAEDDISLRNSQIEFEFQHRGKVIKIFEVTGPDGPSFGISIPFYRLGKNGEPTPEFINELGSLADYARWKAESLRSQPWIDEPVPKLYGIVTDCFGYHEGSPRYGVRTSDKATMLAEYQVLRLMGMNGIRGAPSFVLESIRDGKGIGPEFSRVILTHTTDYPISMVKFSDGRMPVRNPGDGCPHHPKNLRNLPARVEEAVRDLVTMARAYPVSEIWALTNDEIGAVFDGAPEGKAHQGSCSYCRAAFREFVRSDGRDLSDFGAADWDDIRSDYGYWTLNYWDVKKSLEEDLNRLKEAVDKQTKQALDLSPKSLLAAENVQDTAAPEEVGEDLAGEPGDSTDSLSEKYLAAEQRLRQHLWGGVAIEVGPQQHKTSLSTPEAWNLVHYYSRKFNCLSSAKLFEQLQKRLESENEMKRQALSRGDLGAPEARQAWLYSYALRGQTFLRSGHSLDFFDFYRFADNAMVYETSERKPQLWHWDSYLCDVGRSLHRFMDKRFGIYVKPHRGAPAQRALTALARGARMIYWYTYGPDWAKGDTWGGNLEILKTIAWCSRLVAKAETVTWNSDWGLPADVAIVRPSTSEYFSNAAWQSGKWIYSALTHAHLPVDALDEGLLMTEDLRRYRVIVICGDHIRRDVAEKLKIWVEAGGTLYTCGWGMAADEAKRPLDNLLDLFGLRSRRPMESQTGEPGRQPPSSEAFTVTGRGPLQGSFVLHGSREVLDPAEGAEVIATYGDGGAAAVRHRFGRGSAWLIGFYAGDEYAEEFDPMKRSFIAGPVLAAGVQPVVDAEEPLVEGVLLKNLDSGKLAVVLINWKSGLEGAVNLVIRGAEKAASARSLALNQTFPLSRDGELARMELPTLGQGDILLLE